MCFLWRHCIPFVSEIILLCSFEIQRVDFFQNLEPEKVPLWAIVHYFLIVTQKTMWQVDMFWDVFLIMELFIVLFEISHYHLVILVFSK